MSEETAKLDTEPMEEEPLGGAEDGENVQREEFKVSGSQLLDKVKQLLHEGNVRHLVIKQEDRVVMELPLTVTAVGVIIAPVLAAIGAFAALATNCSIIVERIVEE